MPRTTADSESQPFEVRPGLGFQYFRGMNRSADPGAIPGNQFHFLSNVRLTPAGMTDRPGLVPHHDTGVAGCITGMIEIDEDGIGLWVTPAFWDNTNTGDDDDTNLGNFNETRPTGEEYQRYNRGETDVSGKKPFDPPYIEPTGAKQAGIITGQKTVDYKVGDGGSWVSFIKYRKRLLQFGWRPRPKENEEDEEEYVVCLYEVKLPTEGEEAAAYEVYRDLWVVADEGAAKALISDAVSVFERTQEELEGADQIREVMYIARTDGTVWSFDGTTLQEEHDFSGTYYVRLGVYNGLGVFAIGSTTSVDGGTGTAVAAFLPAPGATWSTVTLPETNIIVTDIAPWNGSLYIVANENSTTGNNSPRIYRYQGGSTLPAYIYQFPWVDGSTSGDVLAAGMFLQYRNTLYVTEYTWEGFAASGFYLRKWVNDSTWTQLPKEINWAQDWPGDCYWMHVAGGRVFMGAVAVEAYWANQAGNGIVKEYFTEISNFNTTNGPTVTALYPDPSQLSPPDYEIEQVGKHVITHAPEDTVLNDEEL